MKSNPIWIKQSGTHINGLEFSGDYAAALYIDQPLEDIIIENCDFSFCAYPLLVNTQVKNLVFRDNRGYMLSGDGCCINTTSGQSESVWIHDNYLHTPFSPVVPRGFGISVSKTKNCYIMNNTLVNSRWQGIHIENKCDNLWIFKNTIAGMIGRRFDDKSVWSSGKAGIWIHNSKNQWVIENTFKNCIDAGIFLAGKNETVLVSGNKCLKPGVNGVYVRNYLTNPNIFIGDCGTWGINKINYQTSDKIKIVGNVSGVTVNQ